jgi:excisionase family DNA binding protein
MAEPVKNRTIRHGPLTLTIQQAADLIGVSRPFIYKLEADGLLEIVRLRTRRFVRRNELLALVGIGPSDEAA